MTKQLIEGLNVVNSKKVSCCEKRVVHFNPKYYYLS